MTNFNNPIPPFFHSNRIIIQKGGCYAIPLLFFVGMILWSPNFRWTNPDKVRNSPYGADFLQDWIGGGIVLSAERDRLYQSGADGLSRQWQHDSARTGFQWPAEKYFPMVYPPFHYLLVSPLSLIPYRWAFLLWGLGMTLAFGWAIDQLNGRYRFADSRFRWGWVWAMVGFVPWMISVGMGQKSTLLLLLFTSTFLLLSRRPGWAGLLFGLVAIKPQLGVVIGLMMVGQRNIPFVLGSSLTVGTLILISWWVEPTWWPEYLRTLNTMGNYVDSGGYQLSESISLWGGLRSAFPQADAGFIRLIYGGLAVGVLLVLAVNCQIWKHSRSAPMGHQHFNFLMMILATALISPHFYTYDLTILLLPMAILMGEFKLLQQPSQHRLLLLLVMLLYAGGAGFPMLNQISGGIPWGTIVVGLLFITLAIQRKKILAGVSGTESNEIGGSVANTAI